METTEIPSTETPVTESTEDGIQLGPLFTLGGVLVALGLWRGRKLAIAAGLGAIWLDQRSSIGRSLKEKVKERAAKMQPEAQYSPDSTESSTRA